jgi:hypothetical protein
MLGKIVIGEPLPPQLHRQLLDREPKLGPLHR